MKITTSIKTEFGAVDFGKIPYPEKAFREIGYGVLSATDVDLFNEYARYFKLVGNKHWAWNGATNPVDFDTDDLGVYEPILDANVRLELELKELLFHGLNIHLSMRNVGRYNKELGKVYRRFRGYLDNIQEWYRDMKGFNEFEMERIKALKAAIDYAERSLTVV